MLHNSFDYPYSNLMSYTWFVNTFFDLRNRSVDLNAGDL